MKQIKINTLILGLFILSITLPHAWAQQNSQNCTLIGRWANGPCYAVDVVGNIAYFGNGGYLEIVDFSDPTNPIELAKLLTPAAVRGVTVISNLAYIASGYGGLRIVDISEPSNPIEVGFWSGNYTYSSDVTVLGNYAYLADGYEGLRVVNISDPAHPIEILII